MDYCSERNSGCRIKSYTCMGNRFVQLENEHIKATIQVSKGCDVTEFVHKKSDVDVMWHAPVGIIDTGRHIPTCESALGNNLDCYEGGWHECLPGGGPYTDNGLSEGIHGEVALLPWRWSVIQDEANLVKIECSVKTVRAPLSVKKQFSVASGKAALMVEEQLFNNGWEPFPFMWGNHPVFGEPFLDEGCIIDIPADEFMASDTFVTGNNAVTPGTRGRWPVYTDSQGKETSLNILPPKSKPEADLLFFEKIKEGRFTILNPRLKLGVSMYWDKEQFDCIWYWKVLHGSFGYPWYGRTYNAGLEFWNGISYDQHKNDGTLRQIRAGETIQTRYELLIFETM